MLLRSRWCPAAQKRAEAAPVCKQPLAAACLWNGFGWGCEVVATALSRSRCYTWIGSAWSFSACTAQREDESTVRLLTAEMEIGAERKREAGAEHGSARRVLRMGSEGRGWLVWYAQKRLMAPYRESSAAANTAAQGKNIDWRQLLLGEVLFGYARWRFLAALWCQSMAM